MGHLAGPENRGAIRLPASRTKIGDERAAKTASGSQGAFKGEEAERRSGPRSRRRAERGALAPAEEAGRSAEQVGQVLGDRMEVALLHKHIRIRIGKSIFKTLH